MQAGIQNGHRREDEAWREPGTWNHGGSEGGPFGVGPQVRSTNPPPSTLVGYLHRDAELAFFEPFRLVVNLCGTLALVSSLHFFHCVLRTATLASMQDNDSLRLLQQIAYDS